MASEMSTFGMVQHDFAIQNIGEQIETEQQNYGRSSKVKVKIQEAGSLAEQSRASIVTF